MSVKTMFYMIQKDVTEDFEPWWVSSKGDVRIWQHLAASRDEVTYYCSQEKLTEVFNGRYFVDTEVDMPELENELMDIHDEPSYLTSRSVFWSDFTSEDGSVDGIALGMFDVETREGYEQLLEAMHRHGG